MTYGSLAFVLHSHIPYVRKAGRWDYGEEWLHQVMAATYIPLLNSLYKLKSEGIEPRLTLNLSPILLEQIAAADVLNHFELYLEERIIIAEATASQSEIAPLARWYRDWYSAILTAFRDQYARDLIGAFKQLHDAGNLELLASPATQGYLPLFERDASVYAQLKIGINTMRQHFGFAPRGVWLPGCGYRPAFMLDRQYKPGIEEFLADLNLSYFIADSPVVTGRKTTLVPSTRKAVVRADDRPEAKSRTTLEPYWVQAANVVVFTRDAQIAQMVWSANGYANDFVYREFDRRDARSGLRYWRVTATNAAPEQKEFYDPQIAFAQVRLHAEHFANALTRQTRTLHFQNAKPGIIVMAFDTESLGHRWFEGIAWFEHVLRCISTSQDIELTSPGAFLDHHPPTQVISLPESSWSASNDHATWLNAETAWMWDAIHSAEREMETLVAKYPCAEGDRLAVLNQAARELLLLQSSDWQSLIAASQAKEYARGVFQQHLARFQRLSEFALRELLTAADRRFLANIAELDNPFAEIDYRLFASRE